MLVYRIRCAFFFGAAAAVGAALDRIGQHPRIVVLDFAEVPLVDSTAATTLERFVETLRRSGSRVYIAGAGKPARRSLLLARLRRPLVCYDATVDDALHGARHPDTGARGSGEPER